MTKMLKIDNSFTPCPTKSGDELYPNGIFEFNITKMLEFIQKNIDCITVEEVAVDNFPKEFSSIDESHVDSVDISLPVLLAEISPDRYNLIDGNHRMEKARRIGVSSMTAYKLNVKQHINFLTSKRAYVTYVEYWNDKVRQKERYHG